MVDVVHVEAATVFIVIGIVIAKNHWVSKRNIGGNGSNITLVIMVAFLNVVALLIERMVLHGNSNIICSSSNGSFLYLIGYPA